MKTLRFGMRINLQSNIFRAMAVLFLFVALLNYPVGILADQAKYFYDDQGRLIGAADSTGKLAIYNYDAVGNLLSVQTFTPPGSGIGIFLVNPCNAPTATQVTLQGYGFDPTPANNQVLFNGTAATVVSATAHTLVVTVPTGASTGSVTVTNSNGTASGPQPFTLVGSATIASITPASITQGTIVPATITGTDLVNATAVTFTQSGISATIVPGSTTAALPITLAVGAAVPPGTYAFSVTTPVGVTSSGAVTVTVAQRIPSFSLTRPHVSVSMPNPPVPATATLSGGTMTVSPRVSESMPYVPSASGQSMTVTPPVSESMP